MNQIAATALLIEALFLLLYLWRQLSQNHVNDPIHPQSFLIFSALSLIIAGIFIVFAGPSQAFLGFALGIGIAASLMQPIVAVNFFLANLIIRPWEVIPENPLLIVLPKFLAFICLFAWVVHHLKGKALKIRWNMACSFYLAFLLWVFLSVLTSGDMLEGIPEYFSTFFPVTVLCFFIINVLWSEEDLKALKGTLVISITTVILIALSQTLYTPSARGGGRLEGPGFFGNANDLGALIAFIFPIAISIFVRRRKSLSDLLAGIGILTILIAGIWYSQSRGAIMALAAMGGAYLIFCTKGVGRLGICVLATIIIPVFLWGAMQREQNDLQGSSTSRWNYMVTGLKMVKSHPLFGVGMSQYPKLYGQYTSVFLEYGERTAHSSWVLILAETGIPGLALFIALYTTVLRTAFQIRKKYPEIFLCFVSYTVAMSLLSHSYIYLPYLTFSLVILAHRVSLPIKETT